MLRSTASTCLVLALVTQAAAQEVTYDVRPAGGATSPVQVPLGAIVPYEVTIVVSEGDNDGLLLFLFDLFTDLGVGQSTGSIEFDPLIDQLFDLYQQFGTPSDDDILDIGATQGLVQGATPGVGQSGAQVLLGGELQTPTDQEGSFLVSIGPDTMTQLIAPGGDSIISDDSITTNIGPGFVIETGASDADGDEVADEVDNCPNTANPGQEDGDGDEVGDVCDNCPGHENSDQADCDGDQIGDVCELVQGQPVYRNAGASDGAVSATDPKAQDVHLAGPGDLRGFEVTYTAQFSTALNLTVLLYENDAANSKLPPTGLLAEFNYLFRTTGGEEVFGATFGELVAVPPDLWFEVTLTEPSQTPGGVELVTTAEGPSTGQSDGELYDRTAGTSETAFVKFALFADVDCNENGLIDNCEVADGVSPDCDGNDLPDECDPDGDGDEIPDACDNCPAVFNMSQMDTNGDNIGDACDAQARPIPGGAGGEDVGGQEPPGEDQVGTAAEDGAGAFGSFGGLALGVGLAIGMALMGSQLFGPLGFFIGLIMGIVLALLSLFGGLPPAG